MDNSTPKTLRDLALDGVPTALREPLLMLAAQHHITTPDDPFWPIVAATANAMAAAQAAGEAATRVQASVQEIPAAIADGASRAAMDVKASMETAIAGTIKSSLDTAVQTGAATLKQAAADLPQIGRENQDRIVGEWQEALATAARRHTWSGFFQKLSVSVALAALLVGALFVGGAVSGAAGIVYVMTAQHRITPRGWQLEVGATGKPLCGPFAGRLVCLARKASHE